MCETKKREGEADGPGQKKNPPPFPPSHRPVPHLFTACLLASWHTGTHTPRCARPCKQKQQKRGNKGADHSHQPLMFCSPSSPFSRHQKKNRSRDGASGIRTHALPDWNTRQDAVRRWVLTRRLHRTNLNPAPWTNSAIAPCGLNTQQLAAMIGRLFGLRGVTPAR